MGNRLWVKTFGAILAFLRLCFCQKIKINADFTLGLARHSVGFCHFFRISFYSEKKFIAKNGGLSLVCLEVL